jgi:hypothetical protein
MRVATGTRSQSGLPFNGMKVGVLLIVLAAMTGCGSSVEFDNAHESQHLKAGKYAVAVADECGTTIVTVAGEITRKGWSYPLLNGTPLTIPYTGDYTVVDPVGWDLMGPPPTCSLALKVTLTPVQQ